MKTISFLLAVGVVGVISQLPSADFASDQWRKIVVISDIHGDDLGFLKSLWIGLRKVNETETISFDDFQVYMNSFLNPKSEQPEVRSTPLYIGADVLLVQMGDLIDRGINGGACYRILTVIPQAIGWTTRFLYGNHDYMTAVGHPYSEYIHPNEDIERTSAFDRDGYLTTQLINNALLAVRVSGSTLLVHGGLDKEWLMKGGRLPSVHNMNTMAREALEKRSRQLLKFIADAKSPLMLRPVLQSCEELSELLAHFRVKRIVVGHTVQMSRRVSSLCEHRLVFSDVMISRWMLDKAHDVADRTGGQASAVIISPGEVDTIEAFYTESFDSDVIFSHPLVDISPSHVPVEEEKSSPARLVVKEDLMTIHLEDNRYVAEFHSEELIDHIETIREQMIQQSGAPLPGLPRMEPIRDRSGPKRLRTADRAQYVLMPLRSVVAGESVGEKILSIARQFHERKFCIGFVPTEQPAHGIMHFFIFHGENLCLMNFGKVRRCLDGRAIQRELQYIRDAFNLEDNAEERVEFVDGGVRNRCRDSRAVLELITPALNANHFGLPPMVEVTGKDHLFISTTHTVSLADIACDTTLAFQIKGTVEHMHSHNLCLIPPNAELADITSLFAVNGNYDRLTLVDFSSVRLCTDGIGREAEHRILIEVLAPFLEDDDDDDDEED